MDHTYWHKQTTDKPLFPDLLWSRPENKTQAGKIGIIGGNVHGFATTAEAYTQSLNAGIGSTRVLLPDSLKSSVGRVFEAGEYAPSNPSGSFSQNALSEFLDIALWSDGILLAGDFGHNSETAIVLEAFTTKFSGQITLTEDALNYFLSHPQKLLSRAQTLLIPNMSQLQKLAVGARYPQAFTSSMDLLKLITMLHDFSKTYKPYIMVKHSETVVIAIDGQISTTKSYYLTAQIAAYASVFWLQNPSQPFEALTSSIIKH